MTQEHGRTRTELVSLQDQYKSLKLAAEQNALIDDVNLMQSKQEFERIIKRSNEIPQEILRLQSERTAYIS